MLPWDATKEFMCTYRNLHVYHALPHSAIFLLLLFCDPMQRSDHKCQARSSTCTSVWLRGVLNCLFNLRPLSTAAHNRELHRPEPTRIELASMKPRLTR